MPKKHIRRDWRVLDVGGGDAPHRRADVIIDKFAIDVEGHRGGREMVHDRPLVLGDIQALPFSTAAFDYVICSHVVEHVANPKKALEELSRVGKAGYFAGPSEVYEILNPYPAHRWVLAYRKGILLFKPRTDIHLAPSSDLYGNLFWSLYELPEWKRLALNRGNLFAVEFEWIGRIHHQMLGPSDRFYNYTDPDDFQRLVAHTPPADLWEAFKRWGRVVLTARLIARLNRVYHNMRLLIARLSPRIGPKQPSA